MAGEGAGWLDHMGMAQARWHAGFSQPDTEGGVGFQEQVPELPFIELVGACELENMATHSSDPWPCAEIKKSLHWGMETCIH